MLGVADLQCKEMKLNDGNRNDRGIMGMRPLKTIWKSALTPCTGNAALIISQLERSVRVLMRRLS